MESLQQVFYQRGMSQRLAAIIVTAIILPLSQVQAANWAGTGAVTDTCRVGKPGSHRCLPAGAEIPPCRCDMRQLPMHGMSQEAVCAQGQRRAWHV